MVYLDKYWNYLIRATKSCKPCVFVKNHSEDAYHQKQQSRLIDKMIEKEKQSMRRQVKLLLLGAGESGKSTFLKQMRIIHGVTFDATTIAEYQRNVYQNIVRGMQVLVDARSKLAIPWQCEGNDILAQNLITLDSTRSIDYKLFYQYCEILAELWKDASIQQAFARRREFQLSDSVGYFMCHLSRISAQDYVPSNADILHARKATKGIVEFVIPINTIPFRFVDVGGQRSQRQKWLQCFESVTSVLFMVSSSEYDQVLLEDRKTNRLLESRNIFETIVNIRFFGEVSFILFLNKTDLLQAKLKAGESDISHYFPDYKGDPFDLASVQDFVLSFFASSRKNSNRPLYHHFTTAIDTENIRVVFNAVKDTILHKHLETLMLQ